jgi:uncharacterized protein YneF (UPF0154 family)
MWLVIIFVGLFLWFGFWISDEAKERPDFVAESVEEFKAFVSSNPEVWQFVLLPFYLSFGWLNGRFGRIELFDKFRLFPVSDESIIALLLAVVLIAVGLVLPYILHKTLLKNLEKKNQSFFFAVCLTLLVTITSIVSPSLTEIVLKLVTLWSIAGGFYLLRGASRK